MLDASGKAVDAGWLTNQSAEHTLVGLRSILSAYGNGSVAVGIDAPRRPLTAPRHWYWQDHRWAPRTDQVGNGRHCEVVIAAHRLANPQWTPWQGPFPTWMLLGFLLFDGLSEFAVHEVFPSASYAILRNDPSVQIAVRVGDFAPHPKDMLDAYIAAATVREFVQERGCEVGGGDGLGTILLPRKLVQPITEVLTWPSRVITVPAVSLRA